MPQIQSLKISESTQKGFQQQQAIYQTVEVYDQQWDIIHVKSFENEQAFHHELVRLSDYFEDELKRHRVNPDNLHKPQPTETQATLVQYLKKAVEILKEDLPEKLQHYDFYRLDGAKMTKL